MLSAEAADSTSVEDGADGRTSPSGLSLEGVYKRLKLETLGLDDGTVRLESKDTDFGVRGREDFAAVFETGIVSINSTNINISFTSRLYALSTCIILYTSILYCVVHDTTIILILLLILRV